jgi:UDP-glucose:(heptosyl)LPS alpha-1,3-glucosyltransferase
VALQVALVRSRYTGSGGAERFVQRAMDALGNHGLEVSVLARQWHAKQQQQAVRWIKLDPFYLGSRWRDSSFASAVQLHLKDHRYDLVQSHERIAGVQLYRAGDGVHAAFLKRRMQFLSPFKRLGLALNPHHRWVLKQERLMFTHPALQAVICNSMLVRDEIVAHFGVPTNKLHVIRNGINLQEFCPPTAEQAVWAKQSLGLSDTKSVLGFVGSGFERKGLATCLQALAKVQGTKPVLLVAGKDKHQANYENLAKELGLAQQVRFLGAVQTVQQVLWACSVMLLPAVYDPFPNAAIEALACGVPLITSDGCGVAELIDPYRRVGHATAFGQIVAPGDVQGTADAIERMLADSGHQAGAQAVRSAARASVADLDLQTMAGAMVALYKALLNAPTTGLAGTGNLK